MATNGRMRDLTGQRFGKLVALEPTGEKKDHKFIWRFICDCGNYKEAVGRYVVSGKVRSCGCLSADQEFLAERFKESRIEKTCPVCQKKFTRKLSHAQRATYCSKACLAEGYKEKMAGESNPNYRGGTDEEKIREARKLYRAKNQEMFAAINRNTKAQRKAVPGKHTADDVAKLRVRQDGKCAMCKCGLEGDGHIDHIIPVSKGGTNFVGNIQLLCAQCNLRKKVLMPIEYRHRVLKGMTEDAEQSKLFDWAYHQAAKDPRLAMMYHSANGGYRTKATAAKMQAMGLKKGIPDVTLAVPSNGYHGLFIELKVGKNKPTPEQRAWLSALAAEGYKTAVCYGWIEAKEVIESYLG